MSNPSMPDSSQSEPCAPASPIRPTAWGYEPKMHLPHPLFTYSRCGQQWDPTRITTERRLVTCKKCLQFAYPRCATEDSA